MKCYITGQSGKFRVKNTTLCLRILFWYFCLLLVCLFVFHKKIVILSFFIFCFNELPNFRNRILTNQKPELSVKMYVISKFMTSHPGKQTIVIHVLPNISRSKSNQTMKFAQIIDLQKIIHKSLQKIIHKMWRSNYSHTFF